MFETEYFRITETELQLLRSKFPYKKIPFEQLRRVELTRGSRIKYPLRTLIFGIVVIAISIFILLQMGEFHFPKPGETDNPKGPLVVLIVFGTMIFTGLASIYMSTIKTLILRANIEDGTTEVLELSELKNTNQLHQLEQFLKSKLPANSLSIGRNWNG